MSELSGEHQAFSAQTSRKGPLAWMAQNSVAANLLMFLFLVGGILMIGRVKQEVFPEVSLDQVQVTVAYPGASPLEVEQGVILVVEEAIRSVDGIKELRSTAREGSASITAELMLGTRGETALNDIKSAVDRVTSIPQEAERPVISLSVMRSEVLSLVLYGEASEKALRELGERVRDDLLDDPRITLVELGGVRAPEITVEVPEQALRRYGLTLDQVATAIGRASVELPAGGIKTSGGEVLLRTDERRVRGHEFEEIVVLSQPDGSQVRVGDLGAVVDGFQEVDREATFNGLPAIQVRVFRVGNQKPLEISELVHAYIDANAQNLAPGIELAVWNDSSEIYRDRINLLLKNAFIGLLLVLFVLGLFLDLRLAFWVTMGIAISFLGAVFFLPAMDVSINMISLFAFILALGIVVDDAIVVGEAIYKRRTEGLDHLDAAIAGVRDVAQPVIFSVLTTVIAFSPLLFVPGTMGKIFMVIPLIVIPILLLSLVESLFILPAHLSHGRRGPARGPLRFIGQAQARFSAGVERFIAFVYRPTVSLAIRYRYITFAISLAMVIVTLGTVASGKIKFTFFPKIEGDVITANLLLPYGAAPQDTRALIAHFVEAAQQVMVNQGGAPGLSRGIYAELGSIGGGHGMGATSQSGGGHAAQISVFLVPLGERSVTAASFAQKWRAQAGELAGIETLSFNFSTGPQAGSPINVELSHSRPGVLEEAAARLATTLKGYAGVFDVDSGVSGGKEQLNLRIKPEARGFGLTEIDMARQVRHAFYGAEAVRQQRGRDELRVFARLPLEERRSEYNLEQMFLRLPSGGEIPLSQAATVERGRSYTEIIRKDGRRILSVTGDLDPTVTTGNEIGKNLRETVMPQLLADYPGLGFAFGGEQQSQAESLGALKSSALFALLAMFALMAIAFKSYLQPLLIMFAIPFGIVGAIAGHVLMGYDMSLMSMMGMVALSGVVVNDSLVLISAINEYRRQGMSVHDALLDAGTRRFRPIVLTSLTTFFGLAPMILETSVQARFLVPMAISLGFGVLFVTFIALILVPTTYVILEDIKGAFAAAHRLVFGASPA
ncbi:MAG: efflux RND transporter permease subunit [Bradymonadaceae bacterium]|nr:efflux RND transporter permease subunit [Lujinxingiaceae bacterium]